MPRLIRGADEPPSPSPHPAGDVAIALSACQAAAEPPRTITLQTLNGSGVTGTVTFAHSATRQRLTSPSIRAATRTCPPISIPGRARA